MMDPIFLARLARIRQQEFLEQAAQDREQRLTIIQWSRIFEPIQAFLQRRSRRSAFQPSSALVQGVFEECPCE